MSNENHAGEYWLLSQLAARYERSKRTLNRWIVDGIFPQPDLIVNGHRLWKDSTREGFENGPRQRGTILKTPTTCAADQVAA